VGTRSGQSGEIRMTSGSDQQTLYAWQKMFSVHWVTKTLKKSN
jgi:hypothetical protein